jgi:hypothetical protein
MDEALMSFVSPELKRQRPESGVVLDEVHMLPGAHI